MTNQAASLEYVAQHLEEVLMAPYARDVALKLHDGMHNRNKYRSPRELIKSLVKGRDEPVELFIEEVLQALDGMFLSDDEFKPSLRISRLGDEPFTQALESLGYKTKTDLDNLWILLAGHLFEAWTRFVLRTRGFKIHYGDFDQTALQFQGIKGHYDFILETPQGRKIVCEVKHVSSYCLKQLLTPVKGSGGKAFHSRFSDFAFENDERGYTTQLSVYSQTLDMEGLLIAWDKGNNRYHVVPLTPTVQGKALSRVKEIIPVLKSVTSVTEAFDRFEIPTPFDRVSKGQPTGQWYIPTSMRYLEPRLVNSLYEVDPEDSRFSLRPVPRGPAEAIEVGLSNGYFTKDTVGDLATWAINTAREQVSIL